MTLLTSILLLYLFMPDYPATNPNLSYPRALFTTLTLPFHHPPILQAALVLLFLASTHTNFWTYLTFLLSDTYSLQTEAIGLFSLLALPGAALNPLFTSLLQNRLHPALAAMMAVSLIRHHHRYHARHAVPRRPNSAGDASRRRALLPPDRGEGRGVCC